MRFTGEKVGLRRKAFTLIEMLVVISILLIVATLTISLINVSAKSDRIRSAARDVQSYAEGARDRAIFMRKPVGVRFLVDEDPHTISNMIHVAATDDWDRGSVEIHREDNVDNITGMPPADGIPDPSGAAVVVKHLDSTGAPGSDEWFRLKQQGLLTDGMQIRLNGNWYTVSTANLITSEPDRLDLTAPYTGSGLTAGDPALAATAYRLTLAPTIMANQEPRRLPTGIVIHRTQSELPGDWTYPVWAPSTDYTAGQIVYPTPFRGVVFQAQADGTSGAAAPSWPDSGPITEGSVDWVAVQAPTLDVLFSPRGTVTGSTASAGVMHFLLADRVDIDMGRGIGHPEKEGDELVCTLFTTAGTVSTSPVDTTGNGDNVPDDPFFFAEAGEVAK